MKKILLAILLLFFLTNKSHALSLNEAINIFYKKNNQLKSEKMKLKETKASTAGTVLSVLPDIRYGKTISQNSVLTLTNNSLVDLGARNLEKETFSISGDLSVARLIGAPAKSISILDAQKILFRINEQNLLLNAIETYLSVIRDEEILKTANENVMILEKYANLVKRRFDFGEVTKTDVEQSKARLSDAKSTKIQAEGRLKVSKANFIQIFRIESKSLFFPKEFPIIPSTFEEFEKLTKKNNLNLKYSDLNRTISKEDLVITTSAVLPFFSYSRTKVENDDNLLFQNIRKQEATEFSVTVPLVPRGGGEYGRVIQSKYAVNRAIYDYKNAKYELDSKITATWEDLQTTNANMISTRDTLAFNKSALESVKKEAQYGSRTTLDVLNAELEYFNANVNLIRMQHADLLSYYKILALMGSLDKNVFINKK
jgi:outer membrane protein TolC